MVNNIKVEDLTVYENEKSKITVYMGTHTDGNYYFDKHIQDKNSNDEQLIRYTLETFLAEYYLIQKFIKGNLVQDRKFFKQVMKLKSDNNKL
jgi:phage terminase large subunit-like protein|tara:strand:+ start:432 stop:707 length:276 start_codon:yes stop_codon:yes gene_type:complete